MPPRHTYWTILFGDKPTAFRSATQEELLPTFKQIQAKHPDAVMMWFARGKLWRSEEEARAAFERPRFDRPRGPLPESFRTAARNPLAEWQSDGRDEARATRRSRPRDGREAIGPRTQARVARRAARDRPRGPKPTWRNAPQDDRPRDRKPRRDRPGRSAEAAQRRRRPRQAPRRSAARAQAGVARSATGRSAARTKTGMAEPRTETRRGPAAPKPRSGEGGRDKPQGDRPRGPQTGVAQTAAAAIGHAAEARVDGQAAASTDSPSGPKAGAARRGSDKPRLATVPPGADGLRAAEVA